MKERAGGKANLSAGNQVDWEPTLRLPAPAVLYSEFLFGTGTFKKTLDDSTTRTDYIPL